MENLPIASKVCVEDIQLFVWQNKTNPNKMNGYSYNWHMHFHIDIAK